MTKTRKLFLLHAILIFSGIQCYCQSQKIVDKQFAGSLLTVLNAAANQFADLSLKRNHSNTEGVKTYDVNIKFSATAKTVLLKGNKNNYCVVSLQNFASLPEAAEASVRYVQLISTALQ